MLQKILIFYYFDVLHKYFDSPKLFLDLHLPKFEKFMRQFKFLYFSKIVVSMNTSIIYLDRFFILFFYDYF